MQTQPNGLLFANAVTLLPYKSAPAASVFISGGYLNGYPNLLIWRYDIADYSWNLQLSRNTLPLSVLGGLASAYDRYLVSFGGVEQSKLQNSIYVYDVWEGRLSDQLVYPTGSAPPPRIVTQLLLDTPRLGPNVSLWANGTMFIYGGAQVTLTNSNGSFPFLNYVFMDDLWIFFFSNSSWLRIVPEPGAATPGARGLGAFAMVSRYPSPVAYLFGGFNAMEVMSDLWQLTCNTRQWLKLETTTPIGPRIGFQMTMVGRRMVLISGAIWTNASGPPALLTRIPPDNEVWSIMYNERTQQPVITNLTLYGLVAPRTNGVAMTFNEEGLVGMALGENNVKKKKDKNAGL